MASDKTKSNSSVKHIPKDAQVIMSIMKELNVTDYEPIVINQLLEFTYRYVTCILDDAKVYANHAKKKVIELDDVKLASQMTLEKAFTTPPPREVLLELARSKNVIPLPIIKTHCGLRLPPERHCLLSANYKLRAAELQPKKLGKSALDRSGSKNKSTGSTMLKRQSIANSSKTQTVSIPKPTFKVSANTNGSANGASGSSGPTQPPISIANNHQIKLNSEIKMEVEDDYSNYSNDSHGKRKREDDDDFEYEEEFEAVA
ncbi:transcription initiation factor TFIID subunit 9 [Contarinia nasturtii]|uniref:transcription initiation factor TFIID subunit 9 n=1 Tax=Contarinia nasturtii TaxID=265458 RepID=UPI0012D4111F|nr:transcription initiation factor TFIID subunit 9 [Contarinia nasturtii]